MLTPENFGRLVLRQGTVAVVADPHEIANVMGVEGVEFMLRSAERSPMCTFFSIPSCVPATPFDRSGGEITASDTERLAASGRFVALSEMMNVQGVLSADPEVIAKIEAARRHGLPIDGHAPLLVGEALERYAASGITTDHEVVSLEEAYEKISRGVKIQIREGSAARNFEALKGLIATHPDDVMLCTDDSHPERIIEEGHIRGVVARAIADGFDLFDTLRVASVNAIRHYGLDVGQLKVGDRADFIVVEDLVSFDVTRVYIGGEERLTERNESQQIESLNNFNHQPITEEMLHCAVSGEIDVIGLIPNELITICDRYSVEGESANFEGDVDGDVAKIVYINRYFDGAPQVAYCRGFGLRRGAMASTVAHDSHNIIAVGVSDRDIVSAVNALIMSGGGLSVSDLGVVTALPLAIGGIMSCERGGVVAAAYAAVEGAARGLGTVLCSPFMTLSFMSLIVIPELKIGERGLFCYSQFAWLKKKREK